MTSKGKDPDGRAARWDEHRESRRAELVAAAVSAIDEHGPNAGIAEMARSAGVSKPVLYRYFSDKDDLYRAVGRWGADQVMTALVPTLVSDAIMREKVEQGCRDYFAIIDAHPQVFFLLVEHRTSDDPLRDGKELIAAAFSRSLVDGLRAAGADASGAEAWAHGVVGLGLAQGEWWLRRRTVSREVAASYLAAFIWHALSGIAGESGIDLEGPDRLRLLPASTPTKRKKGGR